MRKIVHVDADCFFAAVEMRENPTLASQPLAVGGDPGRRGVVATCNYEARRFGVKSAMPSAHAMRLCPQLMILRPNFPLYKEVSAQMRAIFGEYTDLVEPLSLDEAFLDVTDCSTLGGSATWIAQEIQRRVENELGITVSAGAAPVKFLAKIASDWRKPRGFFAVPPEEVAEFVAKLPVKLLPGVGQVTENKLHRHGLYTCAEVRAWGLDKLIHHFGSNGERLFRMAEGRDDRTVSADRVRKSISVERTYAEDIDASLASGVASQSLFGTAITELLEDLERRFARVSHDYAVTKQFVKIKFDNFSQTTLEVPLRSQQRWCDAGSFSRLLQAAWHRQRRPVRLLGLGLRLDDRLARARQLSLFE